MEFAWVVTNKNLKKGFGNEAVFKTASFSFPDNFTNSLAKLKINPYQCKPNYLRLDTSSRQRPRR